MRASEESGTRNTAIRRRGLDRARGYERVKPREDRKERVVWDDKEERRVPD